MLSLSLSLLRSDRALIESVGIQGREEFILYQYHMHAKGQTKMTWQTRSRVDKASSPTCVRTCP